MPRVTSTASSFVPLASPAGAPLDPAAVLLLIRQQRVDAMLSRLEDRCTGLEQTLCERRQLTQLRGRIEAMLASGFGAEGVIQFLRSAGREDIVRLTAYCTLGNEIDLKGMGAASSPEHWREFLGRAAAELVDVDRRVDSLTADCRELLGALEHELRAAKRSVQGTADARQSLAGPG